MNDPIDLRPVGGLTLNDLLAELEEDTNQTPHHKTDIVIFSPKNVNGDFTNEDSDDEQDVLNNNSPVSQSLANAEIYDEGEEDVDIESQENRKGMEECQEDMWDESDNLSLSRFLKS
ncbi:hypothetical protein JTB14_015694 [Gonioctena quinquepunctata]|nr:hypothetical protein JTB14_015694 [Gonioctena quinquepunctata]